MPSNTETAILERVIQPEEDDLHPELARYLLSLTFRESDHRRMDDLAAKAREGTLAADEHAELDGYLNVSHLLALLKSMPRASLVA